MRRTVWCGQWLFGAFLAGALALALPAQTVSGNLRGRITDAQGAVVANVTVTAVGLETGTTRKAATDRSGIYLMPFLPLGHYRLTASAPGFANAVRASVAVDLNATTQADLQLQVSSLAQTVEVSGAPAAINTTNANVADTLGSQVVANTPLAGRNMISLVQLTTGFQVVNWNGSSNNPTNSTGSYAAFDGLGSRSNTFQTDGINNDDSSENQNRQGVNIDSISQYQVLTNTFSAEFGRAAGAVVLVQTKSGTNQWHGDVFDYLQNNALDANDFFSNQSGLPIAPVRYHDYGFTLGNPIVKNRVFAFSTMEKTFNHTFGPPVIWGDQFVWLPGEAVHGCAAGVTPTPAAPCVSPADHGANYSADLARLQFIQGLWNTPELKSATPDPAGLQHSSCLLPGGGNRCVTENLTGSYPTSDYSERIDANLAASDTMFARWQYSRQHANSGRLVMGNNYGSTNNRQYNLGLAETHIFDNNIVGQFRFGFGNRSTLQDVTDGNSIPVVRFSGQWGGGVIGTSLNVPIDRYQEDWQYVYDVTWVAGAHSLHFGADVRNSHLDDLTGQATRGYLSFHSSSDTLPSGQIENWSAIQNFQRGFARFNEQGYGAWHLLNRYHEENIYLQDDYHAASNLTLNLGARFESIAPPTTVGNVLDYGYGEDNHVEPRLGFAWSPNWRGGWLGKLAGGPGRSSIRGGFGLYHDRIFQSIFSQNGASLRAEPPNATMKIAFNTFNIAAPDPGYVFQPGPPPPGTQLTGILQVDPNLHMPYAEEWSLDYQRQLPANVALTVNYTGNRGIGLLFYNQFNRPQYPFLGSDGIYYDHVCGPTDVTGLCPNSDQRPTPKSSNVFDRTMTQFNPATGQTEGWLSLGHAQTLQRVPDPRFGPINQVSNFGWSYYHALNVKLDKSMSHGLLLHSVFTWSKAIDTGSEATTTFVDVTTPGNGAKGNAAASLRGPSSFDIPLRWVTMFDYRLPWFSSQRGWLGHAAGGWTLSATETMQSGNPFTVFSGLDTALDGIGERAVLTNPAYFGASVDNGRVVDASGLQASQRQLPLGAFQNFGFDSNGNENLSNIPLTPNQATPGELGRNTFRGQGIFNTDVALMKNIAFGESKNLMLRAEAYNLFNRVQFTYPDNYVSDGPSFGSIGGTVNMFNYVNSGYSGNSRMVQLALKFIF